LLYNDIQDMTQWIKLVKWILPYLSQIIPKAVNLVAALEIKEYILISFFNNNINLQKAYEYVIWHSTNSVSVNAQVQGLILCFPPVS